MEVKLKDLLSSINDRFSGPESCKLYEMMTGKLEFNSFEVKSYLNRLKEFSGIHSGTNREDDRRDAEKFLNSFTKYMDEKNKYVS